MFTVLSLPDREQHPILNDRYDYSPTSTTPGSPTSSEEENKIRWYSQSVQELDRLYEQKRSTVMNQRIGRNIALNMCE